MVLAAGVSSRFSGEARGLGRFLASEMSTDKGVFTFEGREALSEPTAVLDEVLKNRTPDQTISVLKGAQVGMTTLAIGFALYCVIVHRLNVGYFLPDQDFADRFDQTRVRPALRGERIASIMREGKYRGASPKGLKEFPGRGGRGFCTFWVSRTSATPYPFRSTCLSATRWTISRRITSSGRTTASTPRPSP